MPSEFFPIIDKWVDQGKRVPPVRLPRLLGLQLSPSDIQLHVFCDASQDAMATCIYFRTACSSGIHTNFLIGRTKVAPLIQESIPKLELQAALMGARLCKFATDEMRIKPHSTHFWTDSTTVLSWIESPGKLKITAQTELVKYLLYAKPNNGNTSLVDSIQQTVLHGELNLKT